VECRKGIVFPFAQYSVPLSNILYLTPHDPVSTVCTVSGNMYALGVK